MITSAQICVLVGRSQKGLYLLFYQVVHQGSVVSLTRDGQDLPNLVSVSQLRVGREPEERAYPGKSLISAPCRIPTFGFKTFEEARDQNG